MAAPKPDCSASMRLDRRANTAGALVAAVGRAGPNAYLRYVAPALFCRTDDDVQHTLVGHYAR
ncbi:MAG: hypothetical protein NVS4B8_01170 [Herpetosiphon sp.]